MADVTLKTDRFPQGTNVAVYPVNARQDSRSPAGASLATATVAADGTATFTGLPDDQQLVAYAQVSGEHRYVNMNTAREASTGVARKGEDASFGRVGFNGAPPQSRAAAIASPSGGATVDAQARTAIDSIRTVLKNAGLTS
jgi:hypothetical protein